jgi:putative thiamine transport system permease protein
MMRASILILLTVSGVPTLAGLAAALWFGIDAASLMRVLDTPGVRLSIASSVWTGVAATLLSLMLAHLAVAVAITGGWRRRLNLFSLPLLAMPHLAIGIGLALVVAPSGLLLRLVSPWATGFTEPPDWLSMQDPYGLSLIAGLVVKETAFLVLVLFAALQQVPAERLLLQARSLGYGRLKSWLVAVAPLLQEQIRLPLAAVLVFGLTNVEMAIPLGPDLPPTFSVMLWRWFVDADPAIHAQAYTGSLLLLLVTAFTVLIAWRSARVFGGLWRCWAETGSRFTRERPVRGALHAILGGVWFLGMLALFAILLRSAAGLWRFPDILPASDGLSTWSAVLPVAGSVAATTILLAAATALIGVILVLPAAEQLRHHATMRLRLGSWLFLPLLLPQMTFLFGVQVLLAYLGLDGTFAAVLWVHLIFALPYLWGLLAPARAAIDPRYLAIARTLGAGAVRAWLTLTAPLILRSILLAMALAFSVSIALYLPTLFAGAGRIATAATEAAAAAGSGTLRLAAIQAILLAVLPLVGFAAAYAAGAALFRSRREVPR